MRLAQKEGAITYSEHTGEHFSAGENASLPFGDSVVIFDECSAVKSNGLRLPGCFLVGSWRRREDGKEYMASY